MQKIRFYIGRALLNAGLLFMPIEANASISYNVSFLRRAVADEAN